MQMRVRRRRPQEPGSDSDSECSDDFDPECVDSDEEAEDQMPGGLERADIVIGAPLRAIFTYYAHRARL